MGRSLDDLGTDALTWVDVRAVVEHRPAVSALTRSIDGEDSLWGLPEQLLAAIADLLAGANWQRGGKGKRPEPIMRPGTRPRRSDVSSRKFDSMTIPEFEQRWAARKQRQLTTEGE